MKRLLLITNSGIKVVVASERAGYYCLRSKGSKIFLKGIFEAISK